MLRSLLLLAAALLLSVPVNAETLVFSPLPMESPETVIIQWKPLLDYLKTALGISLRIDDSSNNQDVVDKFITGKIDLAYLGPLPYIILKEKFPQAQPIVLFNEKNNEATYTCAIVAPAEESLHLNEIIGRKVALTHPLSTCGYFAIDGLLQQAGSSLAQNRYRYLTQHAEVALSVVRGEFAVGGLKTAIAKKYAHLGLIVVAETAPLPGIALVVNTQRVSAERIALIQKALQEADADTRSGWGDNIRFGVTPAKDSDYDGVRQLHSSTIIPARGNF